MNKRPLSVTIIGCIFIAVGAGSGALHAAEVKAWRPFPYDILLVELVNLIAIVCGAYMLRGHNWARWLALAWMAFHVILGISRGLVPSAIHSLFLVILAYFLLRPTAARYFRPART